ncbi:glycosyltransferase [Paraburkholderia phenazinium]|uniref:Rhamnosyltransferase subunit B n=1 Tax=Paraburkholderia phenazinium TaxID=60549 RepID=A0A1G8B0Q3_9BURK|nr:nucleotide disphospho-sugar-binding domain-containing protein [Paraburkholderia phenazinium]SDH26613.1 rhamnosyltransferase subunit B [Paraburkholderia phenazinium]
MAKLIITAIGSAGDVHPLIGIGAALAARGHRIIFCTHVPFAELVEQRGFEFVPIGTHEAYATAMADPALWNPRTSFRTLWNVIAPTLRTHFDTLASLADADTVLVGTLWAFSARLMQEVHGVPLVSVQVSPSTLLSAHAPPTHKRLTIPRRLPLALKAGLLSLVEHHVLDKVCGPALNALRGELGLEPVRRIMGDWLHSTDGILCLFPDWFAPPQPDWPKPHLLSGFPLFNDLGGLPPDPELEAFLAAGERPLVFTAGSTLIDQATYTHAVQEALRLSGLRGILLTPDAAGLGTPGGASDATPVVHGALLKRRYVPMGTLLPRCRALVHHGGIGTAALAYAAGVAQIVTPFAHDQFDNAQRVADSGCGMRVDAPVNGWTLARAIDKVLSNPSMALQCGRIQERLGVAADGCEVAAAYIERFVQRPAASACAPGQVERAWSEAYQVQGA